MYMSLKKWIGHHINPLTSMLRMVDHGGHEDKLQDEHPTRDKGASQKQQDDIKQEKSQDGQLAPGRGVIENVLRQFLRNTPF